MRRLGSLAAAVALTVLMVGSANAAPRSTFNGDFDMMSGGQVVGHITARLWSNPTFGGPAGTYSSFSSLGTSQAQIGETAFYHSPELGFDNVWFKALEIGYAGGGAFPTYGIFVGHFVDMLDPTETDYVEFWSQPIFGDPAPQDGAASIGDAVFYRFDVGEGDFALHVAR